MIAIFDRQRVVVRSLEYAQRKSEHRNDKKKSAKDCQQGVSHDVAFKAKPSVGCKSEVITTKKIIFIVYRQITRLSLRRRRCT